MWFLITPILSVVILLVVGRFIYPGTASSRKPGALKQTYGDWALITGASSGIGKEFAKQLADEGINVILVARRKEQLEELANDLRGKVKAEVITCDLGTREGPYELLKQLEHKQLVENVAIFVNNAGYGWFGEYEKQELQLIEQMIQLNVTSVAVLTKLMLNHMTKRKQRGGMIITSSTAAYFPIPLSALYCATKAFDCFLAVSLWREQKNKPANETPIDVLSLEPGGTSTEFTQVAGITPQKGSGSPANVANQALNHLIAGYSSVIPVFFDYLYCSLFPLFPRPFLTSKVYAMYKTRITKNQ